MLYPETNSSSRAFDLTQFISHLWRWAWLVILATLLAGAAAYLVSGLIPPTYQAQTTVLINEVPSNQTVDYSSIVLSSQLSQTYAQMMIKSPVLDEVAKRVGVAKILPENITAIAETNMQLITVSAESSSPGLAADIANTLVDVFREQTQTLQTSRFTSYKANLLTQIAEMEKQIQAVNDQLKKTGNQAAVALYNTQLKSYQDAYNTLLQSYEQVQLTEAQISTSIVQIEPALPPAKPISPNTLQNVALAALAGMLLSAAAIYLMGAMDDSLKTPDEFSNTLKLPVLGIIPHYRSGKKILPLEAQPRSTVSDTFRSLRTNINIIKTNSELPVKIILITSPMPGDGKTTVAVNLATAFAQNGQKVTLIDANLRRPAIHDQLQIPNSTGLSQALSAVRNRLTLKDYLKSTRINYLAVITSGKATPTPSELLGSSQMKSILDSIQSFSDIVLIDTPPSLSAADASALMPFVDAVLLVMKPGSTHQISARHLIEQLERANVNILGIALNNVNMRRLQDQYYYYGRIDYGFAKDQTHIQPSRKPVSKHVRAVKSTAK